MSLLDKLFVNSQYITPQHSLSKIVGAIADSRQPFVKNLAINQFIKHFKVNMAEAEQSRAEDFPTFNDFFTRPLKEGARPMLAAEHQIASPVDGTVSQAGKIENGRIFQAKGHSFSLQELLGGDTQHSALFEEGHFTTIYLAPKDYHRIHMPVAGKLESIIYVPGKLFSVNPVTAANVPELFARNERVVCIFSTEYGPLAMVLVGAMIVASVETVWTGRIEAHGRRIIPTSYGSHNFKLDKGAEMGRFFLGSTVVMTFAKDVATWAQTLQPGQSVRLHHPIGELMTPL